MFKSKKQNIAVLDEIDLDRGADFDISKLREKMGEAKYRKMDQEYTDWLSRDTVRVKEEYPTFIMAPDGKVHASWYVSIHIKDIPDNREIFVRKYLTNAGMESMLEGCEHAFCQSNGNEGDQS